MAIKSIFDSNRRREIQDALRMGKSPFLKPRKSGFDDESYIQVDESDLIFTDPSSAAASAGQPAAPNAPASGALMAPAGLKPAKIIEPPPLPARSVAKLPYKEQRVLDEELIDAFEKGELRRMEDVLARGASVDAMDRLGRTCLMRASLHGNTAAMSFLIKNGAKVETWDNEGQNSLIYAIKGGKKPAFDLLMGTRAGAVSVNTGDKHMVTPLMHSAMGGRIEFVKALVTRHANVLAHDENHATARWHAENKGHIEAAEYLKQFEKTEG